MEETINTNIKDFTKETDIIQTILIFLLAFLVPTFLGQGIQMVFGKTSFLATHSQFIVGSIVNTCLILSAINLKGWGKILGVVTMPSISTIISGYVFGTSATIYMICMIPAIWVGNFILIYAFKKITIKNKKNYLWSSILGVVSKTLVIFCWFLIIKEIVNIPGKLVTNLQMAMSLNQLITASIGAIITFVFYKIECLNK